MSLQRIRIYEFGSFSLNVDEHILLRDGEIVPVTPKALDLLRTLIENQGRVLSKDALMREVWPDSFVEEANLSHHIFTLRKALGENKNEVKFIETIPRRGYRFVAKVIGVDDGGQELIVAERTRSHILVEEAEASDSGRDLRTAHPDERREQVSGAAKGRMRRKRLWLIPAALVVVAALAIGAYFWNRGKGWKDEEASRGHTIAVLPFKPLTADHRDEALELGMADTLINKLSPIKQLIVRPISEVRRYARLEQDPVAAGTELGVDYVLEGNLQMVGDKTRATMRLLRVSDGSAVWSDKCDQQCSTIFELQDAIATRIASALALQLTSEERRQLAKHYTENTEAYQLALRGRFYWSKWTPEGWKKAIEYYDRALEKDPQYALAYAWKAAAYNVQANLAWVRPKGAYERGMECARKALELDDSLATGHYVMAALKMFYEWDWPGVERELGRAIELDPNAAEERLLRSYYLIITGHPDESLAEVKHCEILNPVSPFISTNVGDMLYFARRYDEAIEQYRKTLDLDPNHGDARWGLAMAYAEKGMKDEALNEMNRYTEFMGDRRETSPSLGYLYARFGNKTAAHEIAENLERQAQHEYYDPIRIAYIYAALDEKDQAFEWLEKAYMERAVGMKWINVAPRLDNLRGDPRFIDLQRRLGLL